MNLKVDSAVIWAGCGKISNNPIARVLVSTLEGPGTQAYLRNTRLLTQQSY